MGDKTNASGFIEWQKNFGGSEPDIPESSQLTPDGGIIIAGTSSSEDGDISTNYGQFDFWILKLNSSGDIDWEKSYGNVHWDWAYSIDSTSDGGYVLAGESIRIPGSADEDYWIVKLDPTGNLQWEKSYGGSTTDIASSIKQTIDNGYIVAGFSHSEDGDLNGNYGFQDYWVLKLNQNGDLEWQKNIGGGGTDIAEDIIQTLDGGYLVSGYSTSITGDVTNNHGVSDGWLVKLDSSGNIEWEKSIGGSMGDNASSIHQTSNGDYYILGSSASNDGDVSENLGSWDYWMLKLDSLGNILWEKSYGGSNNDSPSTFELISDGEFILAGTSNSTDGDITNPKGDFDFWIVKLNPENMDTEENYSSYLSNFSKSCF